MVKRIGIILFLAAVVGARHAVPLQGLPVLSDIAFADSYTQDGQPCPPECVSDSMEIITYYPSPYGYYEELRGDKIIVGDTDNSHIDETHLPPSGTITFEPMLDDPDASDGNLYEGSLYYQGAIGGTKGKFRFYDGSDWQDLGGGGGDYWKPSTASGGSNNIYYTQSGNVGIGMEESDPIGAKLQVNPKYKQIGLVIRKSGMGNYVSQTYSTPGSYTYPVLSGIDYIRITAYGANNGGMAQAIFSVTQGESLYVYVGGQDGYNGGATGGCGGMYWGNYAWHVYGTGGTGGGASDVRRGGTALNNRIIIAGGGGGSGGSSYYGPGGPGGVGGGTTGGSGSGGAGGGTQNVGGSPNGSLGSGGQGGNDSNCGELGGGGGGGGGGGYYGGGGGSGGWPGFSGGGGSSYVPSGGITQSGVNPGKGKVIIEPLLSGSDNVMEWQNESGSPMSVVDVSGNLALGSSTANGYKLYVNGSAYVTSGAWTASDLRFKENILPLNNSLDKILNIHPVSFDWNKSGYPDMNFDPNRQIGLVAQEVEKQIPELVHTDSNGYKAVAYDKLTAVLVEAVKEQQSQMRNQQKKIEILELKLEELDNKK